jgi:hypothetical protein
MPIRYRFGSLGMNDKAFPLRELFSWMEAPSSLSRSGLCLSAFLPLFLSLLQQRF